MQNFKKITFETSKQSFISVFSVWMTVPLKLRKRIRCQKVKENQGDKNSRALRMGGKC